MKKWFLAASLLIAGNAQALELHHAKILDETSSITGDAGSLEYVGNMEQEKLNSFATVKASSDKAAGLVNRNIDVFGNHTYTISNTSGQSQTYDLSYSICCDLTQCFKKLIRVSIDNNGYVSDSVRTKVTCHFPRANTYKSEAKTQVKGESFAQASGTNVIVVQ